MNKKNNALVTIGIPFYNAGKYLSQSILSVVNQSYTHWELILIDDGSNDNSLQIAHSFSDERIKVISDGENKGLVYRLNQLSALANGKYYARMDADDIMHIDRIRIQVDYLNNHPDVDVIGSCYYSINTNNELIGEVEVNLKPDSVRSILKSGCFAHPSILGNSQWFKNNPYDEKWIRMEDLELWLRTVSYSKFRNISVPLLYYRSIGVPTLSKYIKSSIGIILLLQRRKKYNITFIDSIIYTLIYFFKILIYCFFFCIGKIDYLIKRRSNKILETETQNITNDLLKAISKSND